MKYRRINELISNRIAKNGRNFIIIPSSELIRDIIPNCGV